MRKVVLDTNVYISALAFGGKPLDILIWAEVGLFELFVSSAILFELREKLVQKFGWSEKRTRLAIERIFNIAKVVVPQMKIRECLDPDDDKILECAVEAGADYIVTGDKRHLLKFKEFRGIRIISPAEFLQDLWS